MEEKKGFFQRLTEGLTKTRQNIMSGLDSIFKSSEIDDDFYEELEETLIMADIGTKATSDIIESLQEKVRESRIKDASECKQLLIESMKEQMSLSENAYETKSRYCSL